MKWWRLLLAATVAGLTSIAVNAATISGTFNIANTIIVTPSTIDWQNNNSPFTAMQATIGPGATGSFAGLDGTTVTIEDLNSITEPPGSVFGPDLFISFNADPALPDLFINMIYPGIYTQTECFASPAVGQTCTPNSLSATGVSPFNFVNNPPPVGQATATFAFSGLEGGSTWIGNFTAQFGAPFQDVFSELSSVGSVTNTVSATFTVSPPSTVPETGTLAMFGLGLGLILVARSSRLIARVHRYDSR